jgi:hypothetical protein
MDKTMKHKFLLSCALAAIVTVMAGCGSSSSIEDQFVFGRTRVHCADSTVSVLSPFELVVNGKQADLGDKSADKVNAEGHNSNIQILVTANRTESGETPAALAEKAENILKNDGNISDLKSERKQGKVGDQNAEILNFTFSEMNRGTPVDLTIREYIFDYGQATWRVIYQYRTNDPTGTALADHVAGQLVMGESF